MQSQTSTAEPSAYDGFTHAEALCTRKRIGSTVYQTRVYTRVTNIYFNNSTAETIEEKIMRLVRNDLNATDNYVKLNMPQTGLVATPSKLGDEGSSQ